MSAELVPTTLTDLEVVIERGLSTFVEVGQALMRIRDEELYRESDFDSWEAYLQSKSWGISRARSYQMIDAARVSTHVDIANEAQARALAPLLDQPKQLRSAWKEASADGEKPSGPVLREVVQRHLPPPTPEAAAKQLRWAATTNILDWLPNLDRPAIKKQADAEARLIDNTIAATRGQTITPERLRNASAWIALLADALERRTA